MAEVINFNCKFNKVESVKMKKKTIMMKGAVHITARLDLQTLKNP